VAKKYSPNYIFLRGLFNSTFCPNINIDVPMELSVRFASQKSYYNFVLTDLCGRHSGTSENIQKISKYSCFHQIFLPKFGFIKFVEIIPHFWAKNETKT
jgi:hypothetical protein